MNKQIRNPNIEIRNKIEYPNFEKTSLLPINNNSKPYDLEERTFQFARASRAFVRRLPRTIFNVEDAKQFIRASGSVGANYIEANEAIGKKDFVMKIKICRREAKESRYWLRLVGIDGELQSEHERLLSEAEELMKIFGAIVRNQRNEFGFRVSDLFRISDFDIRISSHVQ